MVQVQPLPSKPLATVPALQEIPVPLALTHSCLGAVEGEMRSHKLLRGLGVCYCPGGKRVIASNFPGV